LTRNEVVYQEIDTRLEDAMRITFDSKARVEGYNRAFVRAVLAQATLRNERFIRARAFNPFTKDTESEYRCFAYADKKGRLTVPRGCPFQNFKAALDAEIIDNRISACPTRPFPEVQRKL